jgi:hypothetical protein
LQETTARGDLPLIVVCGHRVAINQRIVPANLRHPVSELALVRIRTSAIPD